MKKIFTLAITLIISCSLYAQVGVVNADSLRLGNPAGTGGVALFGKTYLKNITPGSSHDSILVRNANGSIRMVPRSALFAAFATAADLSSYQTLANLSSDLAASATKYPSVNAVNTGLNLKANTDGSNATGTWGISTTGNAATATSAAQWGTQTFNGSTFITPTQLMGYTGTTWGPVSQSGLQGFLGLGSNAYNSTAYLPLAGGTLTGGLTGTTALFNGNVGIGGTDTYNKLNVVGTGTTNSTGGLLVQNSAGKTGLQVLDDLSVQIGHRLFGYSPSQHVRLNFIETDGGNMYIGRDNNSGSTGYPWTTINIGGWGHQNGYGLSVSTGVTVSNNQLVVSQAAASSAVGYSGGSFRITRNQNTNNFAFGIDGSDKAYIQYYLGGSYADILLNPQGGKIGIGKSNPAEALDVNGKALVSSAPTDPTGVVRKQDLEAAVAAIDLSDYLPLAGGTLSGTLSGTSAGFSGNVTANSFTGAGTGLTGTASGLNIGGNAATVTNGVYTTGNQSVSGIKQFQSDGYFLSNLYVNPPAYSGGTRRFLSYSTSSGLVEHNGTADMQAFLGITGGPFLPLAAGSGNPLTGPLHIGNGTGQSGQFLNRGATTNEAAIRYATNNANDFYVGTGVSGNDSDYSIYSYGTNSSVYKINKSTGNNTWTGTGTFGGFVQTNNRFYAVGNTPSSNWISDALTSGYNQAGGYAWLTSASALQFGSGGTIRYTIDASGNNTWTGSGTFGSYGMFKGLVSGVSSGSSLELQYDSGNGYVQAYNRGTSAFEILNLRGSSIRLTEGNTEVGGDLTLYAGKSVKLTSGDIHYLSNVGFGLLSADGNRQLAVTNAGIGITNALTGSSATFSGNATASSFIKSGGTSSQFLKADGSVDNSTYLTSSALGNYLPLAGGTLSGTLSGTDAEFSGKGRFKGWSAGGAGEAAEVGISTGIAYLIGYNRTSSAYIPLALEGNGVSIYSSSTINLNSGNNTISVTGHIRPATTGTYELGASSLRWDAIYAKDINLSAGLAASGNVTANSLIKTGGTSSQFLKADGSVDNNTYLTNSALGGYLPLVGGTLSGSINGTSAAFSGNVTGANLNISNWNTAYGWGNHAGAGYMTASSTNTLSNKSGNISQWTNDAGYITSSGTVSAAGRLQERTSYAYAMSALPTTYDSGITNFFVGPGSGEGSWLNYGSVLNMRTYGGGGGSLQMYVPYGPGNGGDNLKVRFGNYNVSSGNSWTDWKTLANKEELGSAAYSNTSAFRSSSYVPDWSEVTNKPSIPTNTNQLTNGAGFITSSGSISGNAATASYATSAGTISGQANSATITASTSATSNTIAQRDGSGYLHAVYYNAPANKSAPSSSGLHSLAGHVSGSDNYYYDFNATAVASFLGLGSAAYLNANASSGANTVVQRDGNGYIHNNYFNTSAGGAERNSSGLGYIAGFNSSDYYVRSYTPGALASAMGLGSAAYSNTSAFRSSSYVPDWSEVTNKPTIPTNTNQLSNGAGYITGDYTQSGLEAVMQRWSSTPYNMSIGKGASETEGVGSAVTFASDYTGSPTYAQMWQLGGSGDMLNIGYNSGWNINLRIKKNGDLEARGNVTALSDARLKANIQELGTVSDALRNIRSVEYDRIDNNTRQVGFIAQEVQKYFPALVHTGTDEKKTLSMAYQNFTAPLLKGWQEHDKVIQQQSVQIKQQDERIAQLERELAGLKEMIKRAEK